MAQNETESNPIVCGFCEHDAEMRRKVDEIHTFLKTVAEALNHPMVRAMIPPNMRDALGK